MFLPLQEIVFLGHEEGEIPPEEAPQEGRLIRVPAEYTSKDEAKRWLFRVLREETGLSPDWGTLTGVRPVKLFGDLIRKQGKRPDEAYASLLDYYYLTREKADLLCELWTLQQAVMGPAEEKALGLYVGIPYCPSRCVYCSFPSNRAEPKRIERYLTALHREIEFCGEKAASQGLWPESIYFGGGTPTTLSAAQLRELIRHVKDAFDCSRLREFTVEAGRPDTITPEKLAMLREEGVGRSCINPQSMQQKTLEKIGRCHTPAQIREAFAMAREAGIGILNADLIAGLPEESAEEYLESLSEVIALAPENVTVHTLAVKRSSRLHETDALYNYREGLRTGEMLRRGEALLRAAGYRPYYLYRQKQMTGNFENVGYAKPGTESIYNIKIMEENQSILALGAGGVSKRRYGAEDRLERVPNVSNDEIYVERIEEMLQRKKEHFFTFQEA